jgi:hypothetical protein
MCVRVCVHRTLHQNHHAHADDSILSFLLPQAHGVTHVINVADDVPNYHEKDGLGRPTSFHYTNLHVGDFGTDAGISRVFKQATAVVQAALEGNGTVLVHCANGSNRSVTVVMAIVMGVNEWTLAEAWEWVCAHRHGAAPLRDNRIELLAHELRETGVTTMVEAGGALAPASVHDSPCLRESIAAHVAKSRMEALPPHSP